MVGPTALPLSSFAGEGESSGGQSGIGARFIAPDAAVSGRGYINPTQYFEGVPAEVWAFHVGGYQVCHKWLKDRKGRALNYEDLKHYQGIVGALGETIRLMEAIDAVIDEHGGWPLAGATLREK